LQKLRTDLQTSPSRGQWIDFKSHAAALHHKIDHSSLLEESLAFAHRQDAVLARGSRDFVEMLHVRSCQEHDAAGPDVAQIDNPADCHQSAGARLGCGHVVQYGSERIPSEDAERQRIARVDHVRRPLHKLHEIEQKGRLDFIFRGQLAA
jgi:hypothetical protein